ncbi:MAG TPA: response regulator transcription factor [Bryobacteraceae bacterium]|nr:response regulator transcription factor [Bryobacteraceae bacterium]
MLRSETLAPRRPVPDIMKPLRLLVADDHALVVEGLRRILPPAVTIVGEMADGRALVSAVGILRPDIVVVDISMPLLNGIEAARQIRKLDSKVKIIFLSMHPDVSYAVAALRAGGSAYVLKSSAATEILTAIREVMDGKTYLTPSIDKAVTRARAKETSGRRNGLFKLTARQREVLQLIGEGRTTKEIAELLHVSPRTIEFHRRRIIEELRLRTAAELIRYAVRGGVPPA